VLFRHELDVKLVDLDRSNLQKRQICGVEIRGDEGSALALGPLLGVADEESFLIARNENFGHGLAWGGIAGCCCLSRRDEIRNRGRSCVEILVVRRQHTRGS